jgi:chromosome segregation ATPase
MGGGEGGSRVTETEGGGSGLRARGEEALSDLAEALIENPLFNQAIGKAVGAGERAAQAQRSAMGALNIPSAAAVERLEQRLRSLSNRLEALEDSLDEVVDELAALRRVAPQQEPGGTPGRRVPASNPRAEGLNG